MKKLLIVLGVVVGLVLLTALFVPMFIPKDALEEKIEATASEAMGRQVTIDGAPDISILPTKLGVRGLTVANAEGFDAPYLLRVEEAQIGVKLLPLLSGRVEMTRFDLDTPDINLQASPDGAANWVLTPPPSEEEPGALPDLRLGTVAIDNATITYDDGAGRAYAVTDAQMTIVSPTLDDPMELSGDMVIEGRPSTFDATVTTPRSLAENGAADFEMTTSVGRNAIEAAVRLGEDMAFDGTLDVNARDLRDLIALSGAEMPEGPGFERLALAGTVSGNAEKVVFAEGTTLTLDDISGTGNVTIDLSGDRPNVTGSVATDVLDLRPYVPTEDAPQRPQGAPFPEWSEVPIDLSALQTTDADVSFEAGSILLPQVTVGESAARLVLKNGRMDLRLDRMALYGGSGSGTMTVDAGQATPVIGIDFGLESVSMKGLATDAIGLTRLGGTGDVRLDVTTAGESQADFVRNLAGDVAVELADGAVEGVNIGKIARSALTLIDGVKTNGLNVASLAGSLSTAAAEARAPGAETDFSDLLVDLSIDGGVVNTDAIRLTGPYYAVTGDGTVNLPRQTMRLTLNPQVSSADGEPQRQLVTPILVSGTFSDPKIGVDAAPIAKSAANDQVRGLLERGGIEAEDGERLEDTLKRGAVERLGGLLGGRKPAEDEAPAQDPAPEE